ncbi:MAG: thioredoxin fold domain-containing protein [Candidatus Thiodiazotropha sp.]
MLRLFALFTLLVPLASVIAEERALFSPQGYRIADYRSPLPEVPPAGQRIDTHGLQRLLDEADPVLIDVLAITLRSESADFGLAWLPATPRQNIPGSVWLPNVGYGRLEPCMRDWFEQNLRRLTGGDVERPLVFYCITDCWMSWNAVRRAAALGYRKLYWYPEGSDGWGEAGLPLAQGEAQPLPGMAGGDPSASLFECPVGDLQRMLEKVAPTGRDGLMLLFETADCPYCRRMRGGVLADADLIAHYRRHFLAAELDLESEASLTGLDGGVTNARVLAQRLGVARTPTLIFFDAAGGERYRHSGLIADPRQFRALADYVSGGHQEQMGFREYLKTSR